jgi:hypothetical protein
MGQSVVLDTDLREWREIPLPATPFERTANLAAAS